MLYFHNVGRIMNERIRVSTARVYTTNYNHSSHGRLTWGIACTGQYALLPLLQGSKDKPVGFMDGFTGHMLFGHPSNGDKAMHEKTHGYASIW